MPGSLSGLVSHKHQLTSLLQGQAKQVMRGLDKDQRDLQSPGHL